MKEYLIVCIDDDEQFLASLESALPDKVSRLCTQFEVLFEFVSSQEELFRMFRAAGDGQPCPAMMISDQVMPGMNGIAMIEKLKAEHPDLVCILLTGHAGLDSAKYAINRQLLDQYVSKPIEDLQQFALLVANLLRRRHMDLEERERTDQLARTVEELRLSNERIKAMHAAAEQVAMLSKNIKALDFDEVLNLVTREVPRLFQAEWSVLCFPENGCPAALVRQENCPCSQQDLVGRQDVQAAAVESHIHSGEIPAPCRKLGGQSPDVVIPLTVGDMPKEPGAAQPLWQGYLCMCHVKPAVCASGELLAYKGGLVRDILGANLTNARLYQEARRQSQVDPLTGASTRRVLEERLEQEHERAVRYHHPFCVAMVDVDRFKQINDTHGHPAGDQVLRDVAKSVGQVIRGTDLLARYGGDEFVVLMPETRLDDALTVAERVRTHAGTIRTPAGQTLTISCGLAEWLPAPGENATSVLRRADSALYQAKRSGRNRVEVAKAA